MTTQLSLAATNRFITFIHERHAIHIRRMRGDKWPWTSDPILTEYKFTNVFRELDTGTMYCKLIIREPHWNDEELFFNIASYRLYNFIESHKEIGWIYNYETQKRSVMSKMYERQERGERVFTGAHMITGTLGGNKIHQVFDLCLGTLWNKRKELEPQFGDTLEMAFNRLNKHCPGYGPFISYEVITDLRHTRYLEEATDIMTWANPGPGAKRGICRMLGLKVRNTTAVDRVYYPGLDEYLRHMQYLLETVNNSRRDWLPKLEMRDIEHSLCEWDKYERVRCGEGTPRSKYVPPHLRQVK